MTSADEDDFAPAIESVEDQLTLNILDITLAQIVNSLDVLKGRKHRDLDLEKTLRICRRRLDTYIQRHF
jgi:hypothetical protein